MLFVVGSTTEVILEINVNQDYNQYSNYILGRKIKGTTSLQNVGQILYNNKSALSRLPAIVLASIGQIYWCNLGLPF